MTRPYDYFFDTLMAAPEGAALFCKKLLRFRPYSVIMVLYIEKIRR